MRECLTIATVLFLAMLASASTITVPDDAPTIQAAIDMSSSGETILVRAGIYTGEGNTDLDFGTRDLVLTSESGAAATVIDCAGAARALLLTAAQRSQTRIQGFTFMNGSAESGGAVCCTEGCSAWIQNCVFADNYASEYGGGLYCEDGSCWVGHCTFTGNAAGLCGGGMYLWGAVSMSDCTFTENTADHYGGGLSVWKGHGAVAECDFVGNSAAYGGGMDCTPQAGSVVVHLCTFFSGEAVEGGGLWASCTWGEIEISNSTFAANSASDYGGALYFSDSDGSLTESIVAFSTHGGGIACAGMLRNLDIEGCCIFGNGGGEDPDVCGNDLGNMFADPLFCGLATADLTLCVNSPCVDVVPIGAHNYGCGPCTSPVDNMSWGMVKALYR